MVNFIFKLIIRAAFKPCLRAFYLFEKNITLYLTGIKNSLGFEYVNKLLLFVSNYESILAILRHFGATVGSKCRINSPINVQNAIESFDKLTIGNNCHIGKDVLLDLANKITIADNVTISMRCSIITHFDVGDSTLSLNGFSRKDGDVFLCDNVYLGCGVTVLHGVTIGANSLIGAGAVVTTDIPPDSIAVGTPAKVIKKIDTSTQS
jgi:acetyltransferase-like isoleucine patch superfamily enzyme